MLIADYMLAFQRETRRHSRFTHLSLSESVLLDLLYHHQGATLTEIANAALLDKSTISRMLRRLESQELVSKKIDDKDARRFGLSLSELGYRTLSEDDALRGVATEKQLISLNSDECSVILQFFGELGDSMGIERTVPRTGEHPIRAAQRRLTKGIKVIGNNTKFSNLDITSIQIMQTIKRGDFHHNSRALPFDQSTISRALSALNKEKYVRCSRLSRDKRINNVSLTAKGAQALDDFKISFNSYVLRYCNPSTVRSVAEVFAKLLLEPNSDEQEMFDRDVFEIAQSAVELSTIRGLYLERLVKAGLSYKVGSTLFSSESVVIYSEVNRQIETICEITPSGENARLQNLYYRGKMLSRVESESLVQRISRFMTKKFEREFVLNISSDNPFISASL